MVTRGNLFGVIEKIINDYQAIMHSYETLRRDYEKLSPESKNALEVIARAGRDLVTDVRDSAPGAALMLIVAIGGAFCMGYSMGNRSENDRNYELRQSFYEGRRYERIELGLDDKVENIAVPQDVMDRIR